MTENMFITRSSGVHLADEYQLSEALTPQPDAQVEVYEWPKEFWIAAFKTRGLDIPMPCMIFNKPLWRGIYLFNDGEDQSRLIFVADFDLKIYKVPINKTRQPNDKEYHRYFKRSVDIREFVLKKVKGSREKITIIKRI